MADEGSESSRQRAAPKRIYKACLACRARKSRCDLGIQDGPPCQRCRREHRECIFPERRYNSRKRRRLTLEQYDEPETLQDGGISQHASPHASPNQASRRDVQQLQDWNSAEQSRLHSPGRDLQESVVGTLVSSGNDALNILYRAARDQAPVYSTGRNDRPENLPDNSSNYASNVHAHLSGHSARPQPSASDDTIRNLWRACKFVQMGWFTADEGIHYLEEFQANMRSFTPALTSRKETIEDHRRLLTQEPFLCTTILMLSSRYHPVLGSNSISRSHLIHERLWQHFKQSFMKVILGLSLSNDIKVRNLSTIEAFLILVEWHPRAIHMADDVDGWSLIPDAQNGEASSCSSKSYSRKGPQRLADGAARRSDQISWALLGLALSMAHQVGVFGDTSDVEPTADQIRIQRLLYTVINQLSLRLGCSSTLPTLSHQIAFSNLSNADMPLVSLTAWASLTKILKTFHDMVFPSKATVMRLLSAGGYQDVLDHFMPLLESWRQQNLNVFTGLQSQGQAYDMLKIEYHYAHLYCRSIGIQAACERILSSHTASRGLVTLHPANSAERASVDAVISHSCELLEIVIRLSKNDKLKYAPVRMFLKIVTAAILLLKGIATGSSQVQYDRAEEMLSGTVYALKTSNVDDLHLANDYAALLETHLDRLHHDGARRKLSDNNRSNGILDATSQVNGINGLTSDQSFATFQPFDTSFFFNDPVQSDNWRSFPFDLPTTSLFAENAIS